MDSKLIFNPSLELNLNSFHFTDELALEKNLKGCSGKSDGKESATEETPNALSEEFKRIRSENKKLTEMLIELWENYNALHSQFRELKSKSENDQLKIGPRKRKAETEDYNHNMTIGYNNSLSNEGYSFKRPNEDKSKISKVYVRTDSSDKSLIVKDGYQWRKYGQKVTRENPSPRAYFKCSFAPTCTVKKRVQRSAEDPKLIVATYEGEHNHKKISSQLAEISIEVPVQPIDLITSPLSNSVISTRSTSSEVVNDIKQVPLVLGDQRGPNNSALIQQFIVQQMASSLTADPKFTAALTEAISGRLLDYTRTKN